MLKVNMIRKNNWNDLLITASFFVFLCVCMAFGGASRVDAVSQPFVRLAAIILISVCALASRAPILGRYRVLLLLLSLWAFWMMVQLIPLPGSVWSDLPGRSVYMEAARAAGLAALSRPLSITPDLTINSILSLLPPMAVIIGMASVSRNRRRQTLLAALLLLTTVSCLLGLLQIAGGALYFYKVTSEGAPVGLFANRNHQAVLLAITIPMLAVWVFTFRQEFAGQLSRSWLAIGGILVLVPYILITGSRSGLILGLAAAASTAILVAKSPQRLTFAKNRKINHLILLALPLAMAAMGAIALYMSRAEAFQRLLQVETHTDQRFMFIPTMIKMAKDFFPFGSGFGSFEAVFRSYEPIEGLSFKYFNHAHNDLLELVIEGGIVAMVLAVILLLWFIMMSIRVWRTKDGVDQTVEYGRLGTVISVLLAGASIVDYPLRTPLFAVISAIALCWVYDAAAGRRVTNEE